MSERYANPYNVCDTCGKQVTWMDESRNVNLPCGHRIGIHSVCPSWGPVDGCTCVAILGRRDHPTIAELEAAVVDVQQ